jgi:hypothetical protein
MMMRLSIATAAFGALALSACGRAPSATHSRAHVVGIAPADVQAARRMADSVFRYAGARPDTIALRPGALVVHMPAGALGQSVRMGPKGCRAHGPARAVVQAVARRAYRDFGSAHAVDTVVVMTTGVAVERRGWFGHKQCSVGTTSPFTVRELQASYAAASKPAYGLSRTARDSAAMRAQ